MLNKQEATSPYKSTPGVKPYSKPLTQERPPFTYYGKADSPSPDVKKAGLSPDVKKPRHVRPKSSLSNSMGKDGTVTLHHDQDTMLEQLFQHVTK